MKCVEVSASDWASAMGDFKKRFEVQLQQELSDHGSSITGDRGDGCLCEIEICSAAERDDRCWACLATLGRL